MYIKRVIIEGFRSYKERVATDPFSPKVNCVVGANGSGKSNFFHAISFALSDDLLQNLRNEERHTLLHEGAGHQVVSGFVEIVFDNSDYLIPVDKDEVQLRRTISTEEDEYILNAKHVPKTEVMNLLERAGFSRSNPYYVVQQEKIAYLTLLKDSERLDLLEEIGGTRVYEEKRRERLKIMQQTENKRKQIDQSFQDLEERLRELDNEKEELRKYQQLDKQRRSLEYKIFYKELQDSRVKLEKIEEKKKKKASILRAEMLDAREKLKRLKKNFKLLTRNIQNLDKDKDLVAKRQMEALKTRAQIVLDLKELEEKISADLRAKEEAEKHMGSLKKEIRKCRKELNKSMSSHQSEVIEEEEISKCIIDREKQLSILYRKQGWPTQFATKAARDEWLQRAIEDLQRVLLSHMAQEKKLHDESQELKDEDCKLDIYIEERKAELKRQEAQFSSSQKVFYKLRKPRDKLQDKRKSLWKEEGVLSAEVDRLKSELVRAQKRLDDATPGDIRRGLNSVYRIIEDHNIRGVFGPMLELFDCDEKFYTAVEVTAGNSLFHVVVETDEISTKIISLLNSEKGGRVTFVPLNQFKATHIDYPHNPDVEPLLKKLNFRPEYVSAFKQVFGRTVICPNLDVATNVARSNGLDCITLEGDQVSKKGGMTGGFYDNKRSKLKFMSRIKRSKMSVHEKTAELDAIKDKLKEIDPEITTIVSEQQEKVAQCGYVMSEIEQLKRDIANATKQKASFSEALEKKKKMLANAHKQQAEIRAGIAMKQAKMGTDLIDQLTPQEENLPSILYHEIAELKVKFLNAKSDRIETETRKKELETNLSTNLVWRQHELEVIISSAASDLSSMEADMKKWELKKAEATVDELTQQLKGVVENIDDLKKESREKEASKENLKKIAGDVKRMFQSESTLLKQLLSEKNMLLSKHDDCMKKIRDLGSLPSDAFDTCMVENIKQLQKALCNCEVQLQKFNHVNKKALDQYMNFTEQREQLQKRRAELDAGNQKINELISDLKKDESIVHTFKGVARHFRQVFSELVQGGVGRLVMTKEKDGDLVDDDHDEDGPRDPDPEGRVENYIGVKVKVSFTGQGGTQSMEQLSDGQKAVVALALIFAIQRCDPAPFYLLDEIDAALDPQYRTAVGNMVRQLAEMANSQVIAATLLPEVVRAADKIFAVTQEDGVSRVGAVSKEQALEFVEPDQAHNT